METVSKKGGRMIAYSRFCNRSREVVMECRGCLTYIHAVLLGRMGREVQCVAPGPVRLGLGACYILAETAHFDRC